MYAEAELRRLAPLLPRVSVHGPWSRAVKFRHLQGPPPGTPAGGAPQPLWSAGARKNGARLTPRDTSSVRSFDSLYVAEDHMTSLKEVRSVFDNPHGPAFVVSTPPWVLLTVVGQVTDVVDLTDMAVQAELGTTSSELSGEWLWSQKEFLLGRAPMPPTQLLGGLAYESRVIKGLRYRSAPNVNSGVALLLFPDRLTSGDWLEVYDNESPPVLAQRLP